MPSLNGIKACMCLQNYSQHVGNERTHFSNLISGVSWAWGKVQSARCQGVLIWWRASQEAYWRPWLRWLNPSQSVFPLCVCLLSLSFPRLSFPFIMSLCPLSFPYICISVCRLHRSRTQKRPRGKKQVCELYRFLFYIYIKKTAFPHCIAFPPGTHSKSNAPCLVFSIKWMHLLEVHTLPCLSL